MIEGVILLVRAGYLPVDGVRGSGRDEAGTDNEREDARPEAAHAPPATPRRQRHASSSSSLSAATGLPRRCERITRPPRIAAPMTTIPETM